MPEDIYSQGPLHTKTHPLCTDRSHEGPQNFTRETPLVTLDADHFKPRGPHPLQRIQHRDPSLHTAGIITYYQNTPPMYRQKPRGTPKFHQGNFTSHSGCRSFLTTGTTPTPADTDPSLHTAGINQNTPPMYRQKPRGTPKSHQGDSSKSLPVNLSAVTFHPLYLYIVGSEI